MAEKAQGAMAEKTRLLAQLRAAVQADLEVITASQEDAQAGATHEENKAEGDKDMRSTEDSYLARGLAKRVTELRAAVAMLATFQLRSFGDDSRVSLSALVDVEDEDGDVLRYFVAPVGGGIVLGDDASRVMVVTPSSPLGDALIGRELDDDIELQTPQGSKNLCLVGIC